MSTHSTVDQTIKCEQFEHHGLKVYVRRSPSADAQVLVMSHGLGEHAQRHFALYDHLKTQYHCVFYDLRGHGLSEGERGYIEDFGDFAKDLSCVCEWACEHFSQKQVHLYVHSLSGAIVLSALRLGHLQQSLLKSLFFSSPAIGAFSVLGPFFNHENNKVADFLANRKIKTRLSGLLNIKKLSHDPKVYEAYNRDPLTVKRIYLHLFFSLLQHMRLNINHHFDFRIPTFFIQGTQDALVSCDEARKFCEKEQNIQLSLYKNAWHEIHFEREPYFSRYKDEIRKFYHVDA